MNFAPHGIECLDECGNQEQVLHLCQSQMLRCLIMTTHVFYHLTRKDAHIYFGSEHRSRVINNSFTKI